MMNLDEAIKHCEEVAEKQDKLCEISVTERAKEQNSRCADEHRQLAEWLKELKEYKSEIPTSCGDAISRQEVLEIINFEEKWLLDAKSHNEDTKIAFSAIKSKISELTSVNPSRKTDDGGMK